MKTLLKKFVILLIIQCCLIIFLPGLSVDTFDATLLFSICILFSIVFLYGTRRISKGISVSQSRFNALYFGMMGLRMLLALVLIVIYLKINTIPNKAGVIFLICVYFVYIGFEIQFILPKLRTDSKKSQNADNAQK